MSRHWRRNKGGWERKSHPKPYTEAWAAARDERAASRPSLPLKKWQPRDPHGFIAKQEEGITRLYDPGEIDRWLWEHAQGADDD